MPVRTPAYCEGGLEAREELLEWLSKFLRSTENEEPLDVTLSESSKGQDGEEVDAYQIGFEPDDLKRKVQLIITDAEKRALVLKGRVKFSVRVRGQRGSLVFGLDVIGGGVRRAGAKDDEDEEDEEDDLDELETPTRRGFFGQLMRHDEQKSKDVRAVYKESRELMREMRIEMNSLRVENKDLREANRSMLRLEQELHNMAHARAIDLKREAKVEDRKDELVQGVKAILPAVAGKVLGFDPSLLMRQQQAPQTTPAGAPGHGGTGAPGGDTRDADQQDIDFLMASFSYEQAEKIRDILKPEQAERFTSLYMRSADRIEKRQAQAQAQANGTNGTSAANGNTNGTGAAYGKVDERTSGQAV